ncbi:MAG: MATE family efflux transporter, partial [Sneathiella sp.]|nr:MATE family efflux transporter [Sneathiella sp.]
MSVFFTASAHREVWHRAWPIILANLSVPLLGAVDTAVIGHLSSPAYLGAVAIGAMIFSFLYWGFGFLRMGTTGFVAQAAGAKDADGIRTVLAQSVLIGIGGAFFLIMLQVPAIETALYLIDSTSEVEQGASTYFSYRIWGAPAVLVNYAFLGFFIGLGKTRAALIMQIFMNLVNISLDLVFVLILDMKIPGVALATMIAEYSAIFVGVFLVRKELYRLGGQWLLDAIFSLSGFRKLISVNLDIFIRTILLIFALAYFTAEAAKQGEDILAATAVLMNFMHFLSFGLDGFAQAAEGLVGEAVGARQSRKLDEVVMITSVWALIVALLYALIYGLFGDQFISILTNIESVRAAANIYLPWLILMPLVAVWSYQLDGIFIG